TECHVAGAAESLEELRVLQERTELHAGELLVELKMWRRAGGVDRRLSGVSAAVELGVWSEHDMPIMRRDFERDVFASDAERFQFLNTKLSVRVRLAQRCKRHHDRFAAFPFLVRSFFVGLFFARRQIAIDIDRINGEIEAITRARLALQ